MENGFSDALVDEWAMTIDFFVDLGEDWIMENHFSRFGFASKAIQIDFHLDRL